MNTVDHSSEILEIIEKDGGRYGRLIISTLNLFYFLSSGLVAGSGFTSDSKNAARDKRISSPLRRDYLGCP